MIGIIGAMDIEVASLIDKLSNQKEDVIGGYQFVSGKLHGKDVAVVKSHAGKVFAAVAACLLITQFHVREVINIGIAGGISKKIELNLLDIVIAESVVHHDFDLTAFGNRPGQLSDEFSNRLIRVDQNTCEKLMKAAGTISQIKATVGVIASGDQFIGSEERSAWIASEFDADAVDMESAAVGQTCMALGVPFGIVRAISDKASGSAPGDFEMFCIAAAENSVKLLSEYIKNC